MTNSSIFRAATMALTFLATIPAQSRSFDMADAIDPASGFRTDRLTPKQLRIWREIEKIVLAADKAGRPMHPRLHSLWQCIQSSGHTVFIEMMERKAPTRIGGKTTLETTDSGRNRKAVVMWLHLWAMDNAFVDPTVRRPDGLIPFYRLGKYERYAELVGHELTHAYLMLKDPEYARLCLQMNMEAAEFLRSRQQSGNGAAQDDITRQRQVRLQSMCDRIERPAEAAELEIWLELRNGQRHGSRAGVVAENTWTPLFMDQSPAN